MDCSTPAFRHFAYREDPESSVRTSRKPVRTGQAAGMSDGPNEQSSVVAASQQASSKTGTPRQGFLSRRSGGHTELAKSSHCLLQHKGYARTALMTVADRPRLVHGAKILRLQHRPLPLPASAASGLAVWECGLGGCYRGAAPVAGSNVVSCRLLAEGFRACRMSYAPTPPLLPAASVEPARPLPARPPRLAASCFPVICTPSRLRENVQHRTGPTD